MDASGTGIIIESDYSNSYRKLKLSTNHDENLFIADITSGKIRVPKSFNAVLYLVN